MRRLWNRNYLFSSPKNRRSVFQSIPRHSRSSLYLEHRDKLAFIMVKRAAPGGDDNRRPEAQSAPVDMRLTAPPRGTATLGLQHIVDEMATSQTYYLQLSALQKLKARLVAFPVTGGSDEEKELAACLEWSLGLYLLPAARPLRKTLGAVVATAAAQSAPTGVTAGAAAAAAYLQRLRRLGQGPSGVPATSAEVATFLAVLELPLLADALLAASGGIEAALAALAHLLAVHIAPLVASSAAAAPAAAAAAAAAAPAAVHASDMAASVECCGFVLTGAIALLSTPVGRAWAPRSGGGPADGGAVLPQLAEGCMALLEGGAGRVAKDQLTQAALALVLVLRAHWAGGAAAGGASSSSAAAALLVSRVLLGGGGGGGGSGGGDQQQPPLPGALSVAAAVRVARLPDLSRLAVLRGVAHGVDLGVLLEPLGGGGGGGGGSGGDGGLMCGPLFALVAAGCGSATAVVQVYSFQVLESFCSRLASAFDAPAAAAAGGAALAPPPPPPRGVVEAMVNKCVDIILRFWENPSKVSLHHFSAFF